MKKSKLEIEYTYDFELVGLISAVKGYKLAWEINRQLGIRLVKQPDLVLHLRKKPTSSYGYFSYISAVNSFRLLRNRPNEAEQARNFLVPEHPHLDYIVMSQGEDHLMGNRLQELLRNIPSIELVAFLPLDALKSKDNFIF